MNFNFGKLVKKLLSRKRNDVAAHAKAPVIEQLIVAPKKIAIYGNNGTQNGGNPHISRIRRKMARRSRTLNSMRRRGKTCV